MLSWLTMCFAPSPRLLLPPEALAAWRARLDKRGFNFYNMISWNPYAVTYMNWLSVTSFISYNWRFIGNYASNNFQFDASAQLTVFMEYDRYALLRDHEDMRTQSLLLWLYHPTTIPYISCTSRDRDTALMYRRKIHRCFCNRVIGNWLKVVIRNLRFLCEDNEDCITEIVHQLSDWTDTIRALGTMERLLAARFERV